MKKYTLVLVSIIIYLSWVSATYLLEGRINLLHKDDPIGRLEYVIITNIAIGMVVPLLVIRTATMKNTLSVKQIGFRSLTNTVILTSVTGIAGFVIFLIQGPASLNPIAISNVFLQTLPGSIAEVVVCWVIVGSSIEFLANDRFGKKTSLVFGAIVSIILFGVYHFAHSEPFNQPQIVVFLMLPGILTSIVYFLGRNIYATIVFHNFQALYGVLASVPLSQMLQIQIPIVVLAIISVLSLILIDRFVIRKTQENQSKITK